MSKAWWNIKLDWIHRKSNAWRDTQAAPVLYYCWLFDLEQGFKPQNCSLMTLKNLA